MRDRTELARVTLVDKRTGHHNLPVPNVCGFPSHPMTRQDVMDKAMEFMWPVLSRSRSIVMNIEKLADVIQMIAT